MIESYKRRRGLLVEQAQALFESRGIQDWLYDNYEALHTVSEEYVMDRIDEKLGKA